MRATRCHALASLLSGPGRDQAPRTLPRPYTSARKQSLTRACERKTSKPPPCSLSTALWGSARGLSRPGMPSVLTASSPRKVKEHGLRSPPRVRSCNVGQRLCCQRLKAQANRSSGKLWLDGPRSDGPGESATSVEYFPWNIPSTRPLARLGKSTRFNLRYYRRRLLKEIGCEYVADAVPFLRESDVATLNANSLNPVQPEEFERRVRSASGLPGSYLCGLRTNDGRWLSLIGGWRQDGTTVLFWQLNALGFEKYSIGTAMRSFYLEDEIARGAKRLLIFGGTSHTMRHGFLEDPVADLLVQRRGARAEGPNCTGHIYGFAPKQVRPP